MNARNVMLGIMVAWVVAAAAPAAAGTPSRSHAEQEFGSVSPGAARQGASFRLDLTSAATVRLIVFDARGRRVERTDPRSMPAGRHAFEWDARERAVPAGTYFALLMVDGRAAGLQRVVLVG